MQGKEKRVRLPLAASMDTPGCVAFDTLGGYH